MLILNSSIRAKLPKGPIQTGFQNLGTLLRSGGRFLNTVKLFTGEGTDEVVKLAATKLAGTSSKKRKLQVGMDTPNLEPKAKECKKPFNVCFCGVTLQSAADLGTHLTSQHPNSTNWKCSSSTCGKVVSTSTNMWKHYRSQHLDLWLYKCPECNMPGSKSDEMSVVMKHKADKHGGPEAGIACPKCKLLYSTNTAMKKHLIGCGNKDKPFKCFDMLGEEEGCGKQFREKSALQHHIKSCHGEHPQVHQCPHCDRTYEYIQGLNSHVKNHPHLHTVRSNPVAAVVEKAATIVAEHAHAAAVEKELATAEEQKRLAAVAERAAKIVAEHPEAAAIEKEIATPQEEQIGDITSTPVPIATSSQKEVPQVSEQSAQQGQKDKDKKTDDTGHDESTQDGEKEKDKDTDDTLSTEEYGEGAADTTTETEVTFKK